MLLLLKLIPVYLIIEFNEQLPSSELRFSASSSWYFFQTSKSTLIPSSLWLDLHMDSKCRPYLVVVAQILTKKKRIMMADRLYPSRTHGYCWTLAKNVEQLSLWDIKTASGWETLETRTRKRCDEAETIENPAAKFPACVKFLRSWLA